VAANVPPPASSSRPSHRDLRLQPVLDRVTTDGAGQYRITYRPEQFQPRAERPPPTSSCARSATTPRERYRTEAAVRLTIGADAVVDLSLPSALAFGVRTDHRGRCCRCFAGQGEGGLPAGTVGARQPRHRRHRRTTHGLEHEPLRAWVRGAQTAHDEWPLSAVADSAEFRAAYAWFRTASPEPSEDLFRRAQPTSW